MDKSDAPKNNAAPEASGNTQASEATLIDSKHAHTPASQQTVPALDKTMVTDQRPSSHGAHPSGHGSKPASKSPSSHGSGFASMETMNLSVPIQDLNSEGMLAPTRRIPFDNMTVPSLGGIPLLYKLGQGGMGAVYYGIHPGLRIEVAVKVLPLALAQPQIIQRFYREAQIAAKIQSNHLVAVRDVSEDSGLYYLVMEYVSGMSAGSFMRKLKKEGKQMTEAEALEICIAATEGLAVAHRRGIIHRDIKPDNILIPKGEKHPLSFGESKLADLGLARNEDGAGGLTGTSSGLGTPGYMAPEQAADASKVKKAADVWSMGAALYGLLAGRPPFRGDTPINIIMASMQFPHDPIKGERTDVSSATARLIDICLSKPALERYVDGPALLEALKTCRAALHGGEQGQQKAITQLADIQKAAEQGLPLPAMDASALSGARGPAIKGVGAKKKSSLPLVLAGVVLLLGGIAATVVMTQKPKETGKREPTAEELKNIELQKQIEALQQQLTDVANKELSSDQKAASVSLVSAFKKMQEGDLDITKVEAISNIVTEAELGFPNHPGLPMIKKQLEMKRKIAEERAAEQKKRASFDGMVKSAGDSIGKASELGALSDIDKQIQDAEKLYPGDPALPALRTKLAEQKKKLEALEIEKKKRARFDGLMKDAGALLAAGKIDDAEKALAEPSTLFASDPGIADFKKKIDAQRKIVAEQEKHAAFVKSVADLDGKIDTASDLKTIDASFTDLMKLYPNDPAGTKLKDKIETRRKALAEQDRRKGWEAKVGALEAQTGTATDLADLKRQVDALNAEYPNDARISTLRSRVSAREAQLAEAANKANYDRYVNTAKELISRKQNTESLNTAELNLHNAENINRTKEVTDLFKKLSEARRDLASASSDTPQPGVPLTPKQVVKKNRPGEVDTDN